MEKNELKSKSAIWGFLVCLVAVLAYVLHFKTSDDEEKASNGSFNNERIFVLEESSAGLNLLRHNENKKANGEVLSSLNESLNFSEQFNQSRSHLNDKKRQELLVILARKLAFEPPEIAASLFNQFVPITRSNLPDATAFVQGFIEAYAMQDPMAAIEWTEFLPDDVLYSAYQMIMNVWAGDAPMQATEWLLKVPDSKLKELLFRSLSSRVAESGSSALIGNWARTVANTQMGINQSGLLASVWCEVDPQSTFDWAFHEIVQPAPRKEAFFALAKGLQKRDFQVAADWANKFPEEDKIRYLAVKDTIYYWYKRNPQEAVAWLNVNEIDPGSFPSLFGPGGVRLVK